MALALQSQLFMTHPQSARIVHPVFGERARAHRATQRFPLAFGAVTVLALLVGTLVGPPSGWAHWGAHSILPATALVLLFATYKKYRVTPLAYGVVFLHSMLVLYGAFHDNSHAPLGEWLASLLHAERNHYDRLIHLFLGLSGGILIREAAYRRARASKRIQNFGTTVLLVLAVAATWEILEMLMVLMIDPQNPAQLRGTQGDPWDTQWDMLMAVLGTLPLLVLVRTHNRQLEKLVHERSQEHGQRMKRVVTRRVALIW